MSRWWVACRFTLTQRCSHRASNFHKTVLHCERRFNRLTRCNRLGEAGKHNSWGPNWIHNRWNPIVFIKTCLFLCRLRFCIGTAPNNRALERWSALSEKKKSAFEQRSKDVLCWFSCLLCFFLLALWQLSDFVPVCFSSLFKVHRRASIICWCATDLQAYERPGESSVVLDGMPLKPLKASWVLEIPLKPFLKVPTLQASFKPFKPPSSPFKSLQALFVPFETLKSRPLSLLPSHLQAPSQPASSPLQAPFNPLEAPWSPLQALSGSGEWNLKIKSSLRLKVCEARQRGRI